MKFCVLLLIAFAAVCYAKEADPLSEKQRELVQNAGKKCIAESGTTEDAVRKLRNGDFATDQKTKCFVNCFLEKVGYLKNAVPQEKFLKDNLGPIIGVENAVKIGEKCNGLHGSDNCETAFNVYKCYYDSNKATALQYKN